jgi:hypothetical protein
MSDVLVVAFDGMDKELIEEFELENVRQEEFGFIDNYSDTFSIKTTELFATFITGENYDKTGIKGISPHLFTFRNQFLDLVIPEILPRKIPGFFRLRTSLQTLLGLDTMYYDREDIECETLFDEIDNSKAWFVPPYDWSIFQVTGAKGQAYRYGFHTEQVEEYWRTREFEYRKKCLFKGINKFYDFSMVHIHFIDAYQHMIDVGDSIDRGDLEDVYKEFDELAGEVLSEYKDEFEYIIFMSDHGLPTEKSHNKNAFYSCNKDLFDKEPKISDFHDKILDVVKEDE